MGHCVYCGKSAGILRDKHNHCHQLYQGGKSKILTLIRILGPKGGAMQKIEEKIKEIAASSFISKQKLYDLIASGWELAVESAFDDGILTEGEEHALLKFKNHFSLSQEVLDKNGAYTKIVKGAVIRDILNGDLPARMQFDVILPFNLQKTESLIWVFQNIDYYEQNTRTRYVGGSHGVSIRIAKGIYYRLGRFKGERLQNAQTVHADTGLLGITNKHIYFSGPTKRFRIAYNKIVTFEPYSDGVGVQRDAVSAKPQTFVTGDGWFTYNLITNLAQM